MLPVPSFPGHPSGWVRHGPVSPAEGSRVRDVPVRQHPAVQHEYEAPGGDDERGDKVRGAVPLIQDEPAPAHHWDDLGALGQRRRREGEVLENLVLAHGGDQVAERDHGVQLQRRAFRGEPFTGEEDPRRARRHRYQSVHEDEKDGGLEKLRGRFLAPAPVRYGHQPFLQHSVYAQRHQHAEGAVREVHRGSIPPGRSRRHLGHPPLGVPRGFRPERPRGLGPT
mmetsp:Transcript_11963/g.55502  ORF Transcript_11963/g.55502 Transcript_11963/m.55502 type:complete len:224 (-) Transcript_11963:298-969(-)